MDNTKKLAIVLSRGTDDERATVAWTIANTGLDAGQQITMFLVSSGVDRFQEKGGRILVCPPCAKVRGYDEADMIPGAEIVGSPALHAQIVDGAATLTF